MKGSFHPKTNKVAVELLYDLQKRTYMNSRAAYY
jgi:hypothetical protein